MDPRRSRSWNRLTNEEYLLISYLEDSSSEEAATCIANPTVFLVASTRSPMQIDEFVVSSTIMNDIRADFSIDSIHSGQVVASWRAGVSDGGNLVVPSCLEVVSRCPDEYK